MQASRLVLKSQTTNIVSDTRSLFSIEQGRCPYGTNTLGNIDCSYCRLIVNKTLYSNIALKPPKKRENNTLGVSYQAHQARKLN